MASKCFLVFKNFAEDDRACPDVEAAILGPPGLLDAYL